MLASLQTQLDKAIRGACEYCDRFGQHMREVSERIIEGEKVVNVEPGSDEKSAAALTWPAKNKLPPIGPMHQEHRSALVGG